jgi:type I restriction enzyme R subunit
MIDEAHRTQSSDLGDNLFEAFPNATRIAFTGTPLITERHGERRPTSALASTSIPTD